VFRGVAKVALLQVVGCAEKHCLQAAVMLVTSGTRTARHNGEPRETRHVIVAVVHKQWLEARFRTLMVIGGSGADVHRGLKQRRGRLLRKQVCNISKLLIQKNDLPNQLELNIGSN
jgi:hypothetical protein